MNTPNAPTGFDPETLDSAVLQSLRRDLRDVLIPELSTENARGTARLLDEMLGWVAVDLDETAPKLAPKSNVKDRIRQEALRLAAEDDAAAKLSAELSAPLDAPVTVEKIGAWLSANVEGAPTVQSVTRVVGGYSKDTWIVALKAPLRGATELILRCDLPFGPGENSVTDEFGLLSLLSKAQIAVPEPMALEAVRRQAICDKLALSDREVFRLLRVEI